MKICKRCGESKPLEAFSTQRKMRDGLRANCRQCNSELYKEYCSLNPDKVRDSYYRKVYGISLAEYNTMFEQQGGRCAICKEQETAKNKQLAVDHIKGTEIVRGLLCHKCNAGLGHFNDDPQLLEQAASYVIFFSED